MMRLSQKSGMALLVAVFIILMLAFIVFGIASFGTNAIYLNTALSLNEAALAAAQAGVYAAIVDYGSDFVWNGASNVALIAGSVYYSCGKAANYLLINASRPQFAAGGGTNRQIQRIGHTNINGASSITVNQMKVEWLNLPGSLTRIQLGGTTRWSGAELSGTTITLSSSFTLNAGQSFTGAGQNNYRFNATIPINAVIWATYYLTDGSSRKVMLYNGGRGGNSEFSIISTGRQTVGGKSTKRTIEATYDTILRHITSWQESSSHI